ncbi:MAG: cell envelope integrity protein TolA [Sulfuritalea sp.]|nr:cell envelope integrity protein TolA [Sulfuritalea sp.]
MTKATIYIRTAKGDRAAAAAPRGFASDLHMILNAIDGKASVEALLGMLDYPSAAELDKRLAALAAEDFIRDSASSILAPVSSSQQLGGHDGGEKPEASAPVLPDRRTGRLPVHSEHQRRAEDLRAKIKARREGAELPTPATDARDPQNQDQARREDAEQRAAAEFARQQAEEQARRDAEEEARRKAAERARQEAEEQARRDAEEEARRKAAERARQEAEDQAQRDAEEEARRKAAERARQEAEEQARRMTEEPGRSDAEKAAGDEAAERARLRAEAQVRLMAEEQAWLEAEEKIRREEETKASKQTNARAVSQGGKVSSEKPRKWGKALALGLVSLVAVGLVTIHLISFDGQIPQFERAVAGQFQQPVKIKALHLSLLPQSHLRLEGVSIGSEGQIRVSRVKAVGELGNLFSDKKVFKSIELDSPLVTEEGLGWILFSERRAPDVVFGQVSALNASLVSKNISLPAFDAKLQFGGEGASNSIAIESTDKNLSMELTPKGKSIRIDVKAKTFKIPFGSALAFEDFAAQGTADSAGLVLTEFKGFVYGGTLSGNARLKWGANWSLAGELNAKQIDTARLVPELLNGGRLAGAGSYAMQAAEAAKLFTAPHLEGSFNIPWGTLVGVDLGRLLQGGEKRGETKFTELTGSFVHERGATQLRQLRLSQGSMSATGMLDVDADKNVHGRFAADLKLSAEQRRANLVATGTLRNIEWRRQ